DADPHWPALWHPHAGAASEGNGSDCHQPKSQRRDALRGWFSDRCGDAGARGHWPAGMAGKRGAEIGGARNPVWPWPSASDAGLARLCASRRHGGPGAGWAGVLANALLPARGVSINKLGLTYAAMNLINPWFGGVPTCHGSGGMAGHYTFGARTGGSVIIYGFFYLILGLFFSVAFQQIIPLFPKP